IFSQGVMGLFVVNSGFLLIPLDIGIIEVSAANGFLISKTGRFTPQMLVDVPLDVVAGISAGLHASFRPLLLACLAFVTATMLFTVLLKPIELQSRSGHGPAQRSTLGIPPLKKAARHALKDASGRRESQCPRSGPLGVAISLPSPPAAAAPAAA